MIRNYLRKVTKFQWFLLLLLLLGLVARWVVPYVMAREDVSRCENCQFLFEVIPCVLWPTGIGIMLECVWRDLDLSAKGRCWLAFGMAVVICGMLVLSKLAPDPWAWGHFHRLTSRIEPERIRAIVDEARRRSDLTKRSRGGAVLGMEEDRVWEQMSQADPVVQEFLEVWWKPELSFHRPSKSLHWSGNMFQRSWCVVIMDDPQEVPQIPTSVQQWIWAPGVYFWVDKGG